MTKRQVKRYPDEFKQETMAPLGITDKLNYNWLSETKKDSEEGALSKDGLADLNQLRRDNKR